MQTYSAHSNDVVKTTWFKTKIQKETKKYFQDQHQIQMIFSDTKTTSYESEMKTKTASLSCNTYSPKTKMEIQKRFYFQSIHVPEFQIFNVLTTFLLPTFSHPGMQLENPFHFDSMVLAVRDHNIYSNSRPRLGAQKLVSRPK